MEHINEEILKRLFTLQDTVYQSFQRKLLPTVPPERIIGVRTPALRHYARELRGREEKFLAALPHRYFDEDQLHAFLISEEKEFDAALAATEAFLPYVDNWATCDQLSPRAFFASRAELLPAVERWMASERPYTVRFGVGMLLRHYLDAAFDPAQLARVAALPSGEYYVDMMRAWYFATALAKQYDAALPYLRERRLDAWTHNKAIQKAIESRRVSEAQKTALRALKIRK
ncbi:MAG: DNA alkylation repair protein [Oscillospiraceae bacterium]|nr:DNA alkylation repair protein [Oscillospiraceae bacterium]